MKTLDEIVSKLTEKGLSDIANAVNTIVAEEKQRGISESNLANAEAQKLRRYKIALEKIVDVKDGNIDQAVDGIAGKLKELEQSKPISEYDKLLKTVNEVKESLAKVESEKIELKNQSIRKTLESALTSELKDKGVLGLNYVIPTLISEGKFTVAEDGKTTVYKNGNDTLDFKKGIEEFISKNPDLVKTNQQSGSGSLGEGSSGNKTIKLDDLVKLPQSEQVRLLSDGYQTI